LNILLEEQQNTKFKHAWLPSDKANKLYVFLIIEEQKYKITEAWNMQYILKQIKVIIAVCNFCSLFAKLPRPENSEGIFAAFESSCHL